MPPARQPGSGTRGYIIPIGGAEDKIRKREILEQFIDLCGGGDSHVAIVPTASNLDGTGERYQELFSDIGVGTVSIVPIEVRNDCENREYLEILREANGVFMTGGNQLRLSTLIGGTSIAQLIRRRNATGMHVAGTSAGAAFIPEHMIAGGEEGPTPRVDMATLAPGLGLTNRFIIDQHFSERDRLGRLLAALAYNPFALGMGLDEDTAAFIAPDDTLQVTGSGGITIVDPGQLTYSSMSQARKGEPVSLLGIKMHILINGGYFDITTRQAYPEQIEIAAGGDD